VTLIQSGAPLNYVKAQLGHSSISIAVDIYGRWIPNGDRSWVAKLDGLVASGSQNQRSAQAGSAIHATTGSS
jgi:integrase